MPLTIDIAPDGRIKVESHGMPINEAELLLDRALAFVRQEIYVSLAVQRLKDEITKPIIATSIPPNHRPPFGTRG